MMTDSSGHSIHLTGEPITMNIRWSNLIAGLIVLALGTLWALQGANLVGGSFMTGQALWIWIGIPVAVIGLFLIYRGLTGRARQV